MIDVKVNFLTPGEQKRLEKLTQQIEQTSGFKLRVLCQSYPRRPALIKDYWKVDDKTIVLIADKGLKGTSNILNFNVGDGLAHAIDPPWSPAPGPAGCRATGATRARTSPSRTPSRPSPLPPARF